ncbi:DUF2391 family protein [Candidatus Woesearchaeota archaeon]|nr:MAG: DUF2391 family protein [Candidatus Woesearchaeota archaeon]
MDLKLEQDIRDMHTDIKHIRRHLVEKEPDHFSKRDIVSAFFGAIFMGLTFLFKGLLIQVGLNIPWGSIAIIVTSTIFILSTQIYFIGYKRVSNKEERHFGQFLVKRLFTIYGIALIVSFYLLYIFNFLVLVGSLANLAKLTLILSMPCAIGAAIGDLLKKY